MNAKKKRARLFDKLVAYIVTGGDSKGSFFKGSCAANGISPEIVIKHAEHLIKIREGSGQGWQVLGK